MEAELHRFPGGLESGFGLLLGGNDLTGPAPDYFVFLIDGTGRFELHHRIGEVVHPVVARASHPAVVPWTEGAVKNVLTAEVRPDSRVPAGGHAAAGSGGRLRPHATVALTLPAAARAGRPTG